MDPDMVRQQAEAEREALALLRKKPADASIPQAIPAEAAQDAGPVALEEAAALKPPAAVMPQAGPAPRRKSASAAVQFGRFVSSGLAGAMLGGGLGMLAASYMQLPVDLAKLAIFGPAAVFAGVCAIASFFAKASHE